MKITGLHCKNCNTFIYSRARHDFRVCNCEECFVDGGFDYLRYGGRNFTIEEMNIETSREELYRDWNNCGNDFGKIKLGEL